MYLDYLIITPAKDFRYLVQVNVSKKEKMREKKQCHNNICILITGAENANRNRMRSEHTTNATNNNNKKKLNRKKNTNCYFFVNRK